MLEKYNPMKSFIFSIIFVCTCLYTQAQEQFSYSFSAKTDSTELSQYAQQLEEIKGVESVKFRYKPEKEAGEFLIFSQKGTPQEPFPMNSADIKARLIEWNMEPLNFRKIN